MLHWINDIWSADYAMAPFVLIEDTKKMEKPINTDDLTDLEVAKLWRGLEQVDEAINNVIHVPSFNFAEQREKAIAALQELRKQQAMLVQAIHKLKNQIGRK